MASLILAVRIDLLRELREDDDGEFETGGEGWWNELDTTDAVGDVIAGDDISNDAFANPILESKILMESNPIESFVPNPNGVEEFDIPFRNTWAYYRSPFEVISVYSINIA